MYSLETPDFTSEMDNKIAAFDLTTAIPIKSNMKTIVYSTPTASSLNRSAILSIFFLFACNFVFSRSGQNPHLLSDLPESGNTVQIAPSDFRITTDLQAVKYLLTKHLELDPADTLIVTQIVEDGLGLTFRMDQLHHKIPVIMGQLIFRIDATGMPISYTSYLKTELPYLPRVLVDQYDGLPIAMQALDARAYLWEDSLFAQDHKQATGEDLMPKPRLVFVPVDYMATEGKSYTLAWEFDLYTKDPEVPAHRVFIDAILGIELWKFPISYSCVHSNANTTFNGSRTVAATQVNSSYYLEDDCGPAHIFLYNCNGGTESYTRYVNTSNNWNASTWNSAAQANWGIRQIYNYYSNSHGRNSWDGAGGYIQVFDNCYLGQNNAKWGQVPNALSLYSGSTTSHNDNWNTLDILGHEYQHGVTQSSPGLIYAGESGAINESLSDVFGEFIEASVTGTNDWLMGADRGTPVRSVSNPMQYNQPHTYLGNNWSYSTNYSTFVHINSGPANYMAFLLCAGGSGTNSNGFTYNISPIGMSKTRRIIYRAMVSYLVSNSTYGDYRIACLQSATDLYGSNSVERSTVEAAFCAIGMGNNCTPYTPPCTTPSAPVANSTSLCTSTGASTTLQASGATSGQSYRWYGSPSSSIVLSTGSTFTTPFVTQTTSWYVSKFVTANPTCESSRTQVTLTLNPLPAINIAAWPGTTVSSNQTITLTASGAQSYSWSGPGNVSNGVPFTPIGGTYTVTGNTNNCTNTASVTITVQQAISLWATINPVVTSVCQNVSNNLTFQVNPTGGTPPYTLGYEINNGGLIPSSSFSGTMTITLPTWYNATPGPINVMIHSITDATGSSAILMVPINLQVLAPIFPVVSVLPDSTLCTGDSVRFVPQNLSGVTWTAPTPVPQGYFQPATGIYSLQATDVNGCSTSRNITINLHPSPVIQIGATPGLSLVNGQSLNLCATGVTQYAWTPSSVNNCNAFVPPASAVTTYSVTGTDLNGCLGTAQVIINTQSLTASIQPPSALTFCQNSTAQLVFQGSGGSLPYQLSYSVNQNPVQILNATALTATLPINTTTPGTFTYHLKTIQEANGASTNLQDSVTVQILPGPGGVSINAQPGVNLCAGDTLTLTHTVNGTPTWNPTTTLSGIPFVPPAGNTWYRLRITEPNGCFAEDSIRIQVQARPATPIIIANGPYLVSNHTQNNQWYLNYNILSGETQQTVNTSLYGPGIYTLRVRSGNCYSESSIPYILLSEQEDWSGEAGVELYPNPVSALSGGVLYVRSSDYSGAYEWISIDGRILETGKLTGDIQAFQLQAYAPGVYYLRLSAERGSIRRKVVLVR